MQKETIKACSKQRTVVSKIIGHSKKMTCERVTAKSCIMMGSLMVWIGKSLITVPALSMTPKLRKGADISWYPKYSISPADNQNNAIALQARQGHITISKGHWLPCVNSACLNGGSLTATRLQDAFTWTLRDLLTTMLLHVVTQHCEAAGKVSWHVV